MIEFLIGSSLPEADLVVTGCAIGAKPRLMWILMTNDTGHTIQGCKFPEGPGRSGTVVVAFPAIEVPVFSFQRISGQVVVEPGTRNDFFEGCLRVTTFAGSPVVSFVRIFVT